MKLIATLSAAAVLCMASATTAAQFEVSYLDGGSWNSIYAQGFSPSVAPSPDLDLAAGDQVMLSEFSFFKSGNADNANDIKLAIISPFFSNIQGMDTSSPYLVGLSDNTINGTAGIAVGDPITFTFSGLTLTYGDGYAAVMVRQSGTSLTPTLVPALVADYVETSPGSGVYAPETNYGSNTQYEYAVSNFVNATIVDSYFSTFSDAADANFRATFTAVPEPSSVMLAIGCLGISLCKRRHV